MGSMKSRYLPARRALLFWTVFIGLGAVAGAANMLLDPTGASLGMETVLMYLTVTVLGLNDLVMKLIVNIVVIILNYVFSKLFIFKKK